MKKFSIALIFILCFVAIFLTFNPLLIIVASQLLVYLFWRFIFEKRLKIGLFIFTALALLVVAMAFKVYFREQKSMISSVAPYAFYDMGDFIEIKGGWNVSDTKYESTCIICDKELGVCSDYTARLINGHLLMAPVLWQIKYWNGEAINPNDFLKEYNGIILAISADRTGIYSNSVLYIHRKNKGVFIVRKETKTPEEDWKDLLALDNVNALPDEWEIVESLQDTFYKKKGG